MSRRVSLVGEVDGNEADADAGHGHEEKYQALFQGAHTPGPTTTLLHIHFHRGSGAAPNCAFSNNSPAGYQHQESQVISRHELEP